MKTHFEYLLLGFLFLPHGDQALAAEPDFHGDAPHCGQSSVIFLRPASDHSPKLSEHQPENDLVLTYGASEALGRVVKDGASGTAFEAVPSAAYS